MPYSPWSMAADQVLTLHIGSTYTAAGRTLPSARSAALIAVSSCASQLPGSGCSCCALMASAAGQEANAQYTPPDLDVLPIFRERSLAWPI